MALPEPGIDAGEKEVEAPIGSPELDRLAVSEKPSSAVRLTVKLACPPGMIECAAGVALIEKSGPAAAPAGMIWIPFTGARSEPSDRSGVAVKVKLVPPPLMLKTT